MLRVHAIGNQLSYHKFHYPVRVFEKDLRDAGVVVRYFKNTTEHGIYDCDVLFFYDDNYRKNLPIKVLDREPAVEYLQNFFSRFKKVVWFDGNDGSGWIRSYIFPIIDLYAKSNLLVDTKYYMEMHPTGMPHRDYVVEKYQVHDPRKSKEPLLCRDIKKLRLSWNLALTNWQRRNSLPLNALLDRIIPPGYQFRYTDPNLGQRSKLIPYRVNYWKTVPTVSWWRERTRDTIQEVVNKTPPYYLNNPGRVNRFQFINEIRRAVVTISPFGLGEDCYRDYESFIYGSLLFKPNMDHKKTWPDFYISDETYISHQWDFSDFDEKLSDILNHPEKYELVARDGQKRFRDAVSDGEAFARHFLNLIKVDS